MLLRGGVLMVTDELGATEETPTFTCAHCQYVYPLKQKPTRSGIIGADNFFEVACKCGHCGKQVCLASSLACDPWVDQMDRAEEAARVRKSYGVNT